MKKLASATLLSCLLIFPATAQDSDLKAVLDALQSIENRLTALEQKQDTPPPPAATETTETKAKPAQATQSEAMSPPSGMVARSGWLVSALPYVENNPEPDALIVFPAGYRMSFAEHGRFDPSNTWYRYMGQAKLNVYETGRHGFTVNFDSPLNTKCWGYLAIDGSNVVWVGDTNNSIKVDGGVTGVFSGFADLATGSYDMKYRLSCTPYYRDAQTSYDSDDIEDWKSIAFEIKHKSPSDMAPQSFRPNEVFYFARADQTADTVRNTSPAPGGISRNLESGEAIVIVAAVNIRSAPSTTAPVVAQLAPGREMVLNSPTSGIEWIQLQTGEGAGGYVKVSALLANARLR